MPEIFATPDARDAIKRLVSEHGPIMFHTSGGRAGGRNFPICLPHAELRLGARDHFLGEVEGAPIYDMEDQEGCTRCSTNNYMLDVVDGPTIGFSIPAGDGKRFFLTEKR